MANSVNLQDVFLNEARKEKTAVTVFLTNGFQLKGVIKGFDQFAVVIDVEGKQNLVYKHAISTIMPLKRLEVFSVFSNEDQDKKPKLRVIENIKELV